MDRGWHIDDGLGICSQDTLSLEPDLNRNLHCPDIGA